MRECGHFHVINDNEALVESVIILFPSRSKILNENIFSESNAHRCAPTHVGVYICVVTNRMQLGQRVECLSFFLFFFYRECEDEETDRSAHPEERG